MEVDNALLLEVEAYISNFIAEQVPKTYAYHDIQHTQNVVEAALEIGQMLELDAQEMEILQLAAWFHDTGYDKGPANHEERSAKYLRAYLEPKAYPEEALAKAEACIMATKVPQNPKGILQEIICDADLSHLGKYNYWDRCGRLRQELAQTKNLTMSDLEWLNFELDFMNKQVYKTTIAQALYNKKKTKHVRQLIKQKKRLMPQEVLTVDEIAQFDKLTKGKKKRKKKQAESNGEDVDLKEINLGRGVETMYRTTYRTHVNLSSIADNKANIMLSINAIIVSITLSTLVPSFSSNPKLILPTGVLLFVCLLAIVFATLSTRPKITEGKFTREDIQKKRSNLLFFGNFYNMSLEDFHWGMMEMIKDEDFLYSSMTRDLYFLGIVLAKKYRYLRICYGVFMYGLIIAVLSFAVAFTI